MRILVLGGTLFLGRHLAADALARGHALTVFTRGRTDPGAFPDAEHLVGDRDGALDALRGRRFDAVIDTSGYVPRVVRDSVRLLAGAAGLYAFVSSVSVYGDFSAPVSEETPVGVLDDPASEDVDAHDGTLKALCEEEVRAAFGDRALVVRPGLIVGPDDPTDRFTYWVERAARGGDMLAPGDPGRTVQYIDVRDLARWMLDMVERAPGGTFNAAGPEPPVTMGQLVEACVRAAGAGARPVWVSDEFLLERRVQEWQELPLWLVDPAWRGMLEADVGRALRAGLRFRPLEETVADTLAWARGRRGPRPAKAGDQIPPAGMAPEREAELLAAWRAR